MAVIHEIKVGKHLWLLASCSLLDQQGSGLYSTSFVRNRTFHRVYVFNISSVVILFTRRNSSQVRQGVLLHFITCIDGVVEPGIVRRFNLVASQGKLLVLGLMGKGYHARLTLALPQAGCDALLSAERVNSISWSSFPVPP